MTSFRMRHIAPETRSLDVLLSMLPSLPRPFLDRIVQKAIDHLDDLDGDTDVELNGDELDGSGCGEDEFWPHWLDNGHQPGCPLSDPGGDTRHQEQEIPHA